MVLSAIFFASGAYSGLRTRDLAAVGKTSTQCVVGTTKSVTEIRSERIPNPNYSLKAADRAKSKIISEMVNRLKLSPEFVKEHFEELDSRSPLEKFLAVREIPVEAQPWINMNKSFSTFSCVSWHGFLQPIALALMTSLLLLVGSLLTRWIYRGFNAQTH